MLRRGQAMLPFFLLAWVLRLTQALASAHDRLQDEADANSMSGTGNLDRGGNLSLATDLAISYAEDLFSKPDYFSPNGKGELSEIAGYSADQQRQSLDHVFSESDATNDGLFDFSQHYRYDEDALEQPGFSNPDSDDFNSDLTKNSVPFAADDYPMASDSEDDVEHALFTDRSNDPDDFPEVFAYADLATSDKENVSNTATLDLHDSVNLAAEMGIGELGKEFDSSAHKSGTYSKTLGYDSAAFADLEKEGTDALYPGVHSYHRKDQVTGDLDGMHVSSFDHSVLTDINLQLDEALSPALKIASALNSPDLSGGPRVPSSIYDASIGPYGVFNRPITPPNPPPHSTGEPTTLASATTCGVADMAIKLFGGRLTDLKVQAAFIFVEVSKIPQRCRYKVFERNGVVHFTTAFKGCNVKIQGGQYVLTLMWRNHYVHMSCPISTPDKPVTICGTSSMTITLPAGPVEALRVKNKLNKWVSIHQVAVKCKYQLLRDSEGRITFTTSYNGCHVRRSMDRYFYNIYYQMAPGKLGQALMSCRTGINVTVPPEASLPSVFCAKSGMIIKLPKGRLDAVRVIDGFGKAIPVGSIAKKCNYQLFQMKTGHIILIASFQSCQVAFVDGCFALNIKFQHADRVMGEVSALCHAGGGPKPTSQPDTPTTRDVTSSILSTVIPVDVSATICNKDGMTVVLPNGPWWGIRVKDLSGKEITVTSDFAERCHYNLSLHLEKIIFTTTYTGCFVEQVGDRYVLTVMYRTATWNRGSVRMECPTSAGSPTELPPLPATVGKPIPVCRSSDMTVVLPAGSLEKVLVLDQLNRPVKVIDAPKSCNYSMVERRGQILFTAPYSACDVKILNGNYVLAIMYTSYSGDFASVQIECPTSGEPTKPIPPTPVCGASSMIVELPEGPLEQVKIMNISNGLWVAVKDVPKNCNYTLIKERGRNLFITSYKACHVWILNKNYVLTIIYTTATGVRGMVQMTCPAVEITSLTTRTTTIRKPATTGKPTKPTLPPTPVCKASSMTVALPSGSLQVLLLNLSNEWVDVNAAPSYCNYSLVQGRGGRNFFTAPYRACDVRIQNNNYVLKIWYLTTGGIKGYVVMKCPTSAGEPTKAPATPTTWEQTKPTRITGIATKTTMRTTGGEPTVVCTASSMVVELSKEPLVLVELLAESSKWVAVIDAPEDCNYTLIQSRERNLFKTPYTACDVKILNENYFLALRYTTIDGKVGYVQMKCPTSAGEPTKAPATTNTTRKSTRTPPAPDVVCNFSGMMVELPKDSLDLVELLDYSNKWVVVNKAPVYCNYTLLQGSGRTLFITPYKACDVRILNENYILTLRYTTSGQQVYVHMKCPTSAAAPTKTPSSTTTTGKPPIPTVCKASVMTIELPEGPIEQVALIDKSNTLVTVKDDTRKCGYSLVHGRGKNIFTTPYTACDVKMLNGNYVLTLAYVTLAGERVLVQMKCPTSAALPTGLPLPPFGVSVLCSDTCMTVELPGGLLQDIQLMDESNNLVAVTSAPKICGYSLVRGNGKNILTAPYKACNVKILNNFYILRVIYTTLTGERGDIQAKCPVPGLVPREGCKIPRSRQVACGPPNADPQLCVANGCCVDATTSQCYYPLNACTADGHFVFSVDRTSTKPEINPGSLVIAGNRSCAPVICTPDFAIFKFPVTGCGTHVFTVAETTIYLAEVHGLVRGNQQMYGQITRDGPYRFQVECRYSKGHLASTGYLVVNPPPPSAALAFGSLGVRLRIATDTSYTSFYPRSHLPLSFLLGSKVYLEVQLVNPPNPNVVLLVHYCIAYPQSSQAAWVILYEGCPNILDYSSAAGLHVKYNNMPVSKHTRRFEIQSFQFLDYKTKQHLDEEIYFMCSTEVCSPEHRVCNEGCFDGRDMPVPVGLGVGGRCAGKPCPGKSNVVKRAAHGHTGLIAIGEGTFLLDEPVPHEQMEKHWTHFHGLLGLLALLVSVSVVMLFLKKWVVLQMARS